LENATGELYRSRVGPSTPVKTVKSDQGSSKGPKGTVVDVKFPVPHPLPSRKLKIKSLPHPSLPTPNISFSPSSLLFLAISPSSLFRSSPLFESLIGKEGLRKMHVTNTKDFKCSGEPHFQTRHCSEFEELAVDYKGANYLAITRLVLRKRLGRVNGTHLSLRYRSVFLINTRCTVVNVTCSLWGDRSTKIFMQGKIE